MTARTRERPGPGRPGRSTDRLTNDDDPDPTSGVDWPTVLGGMSRGTESPLLTFLEGREDVLTRRCRACGAGWSR